ncbi:MAG: hypothetical protein KatS3mg003_0967 [Candidatus Nitrosocaldaceae archaeon]|nr:MAG: hypothetical protein KatS3mg003_0967 [Candidatus Nitrosocaldaceae archaeon]
MKDLEDIRDRVKNVIIKANHNPILAEDHIDFKNNPKKAIEDMVDRSDAYIGIFDKRWGSVPEIDNPDGLSVTAIEYYRARERGIPMLILVSRNEKKDELKKFLDKIGDYHTGQWLHHYSNIDELIAIIAIAIPKLENYHKIRFEAKGLKILYKDELTKDKAEEEFKKWQEGFELDFASIYHNYDYRRSIVDEVKAKLEEHGRAVLIGESGTSKTTIFKRVLCEYLDDHIIIYHDGIHDIDDVKDHLSLLAEDNKVIIGIDNAHTKQSLMIYKLMEELPNVKFLLTIREPDYERLLKGEPEFGKIQEVIRDAIYGFDANRDKYTIRTASLTKDEVKAFFDYYNKPLPSDLDEFYEDTKGHPLIVRFHITGNGLDKHVKDRHDQYITNDNRLKAMMVCSLLDLANNPIDDKLANKLGIGDDLYYLSQAMLIHRDDRWYTIHHLWAIAWFYYLFNTDDTYKIKKIRNILMDILSSLDEFNRFLSILVLFERLSDAPKGYDYSKIFGKIEGIIDIEKVSLLKEYLYGAKGYALTKLQRYEEAIEAYNKALEINPNYAEAWNNKGYALAKLQRYEEAIEAYNKALEINPNYAEAWNNKGYALDELQRYEEAIEAYNKALEINPNYAEAWNNKGIALDELQRYEEAIEAYNKARIIFDSRNQNEYAERAETIIKILASILLKKDCRNMSIEEILKEIKKLRY